MPVSTLPTTSSLCPDMAVKPGMPRGQVPGARVLCLLDVSCFQRSHSIVIGLVPNRGEEARQRFSKACMSLKPCVDPERWHEMEWI